MKFGIRKTSISKSLKARTTGKLKRSIKKTFIPGYGKKGTGWIKNPKKALYNKVYNKTTVSLFPIGILSRKSKRNKTVSRKNTVRHISPDNYQLNSEMVINSPNEGNTEYMKVCKFCGTEISGSETTCPSCGSHEFKYKCGNCGTVFEDGKYCPKCGVKAGAVPKKCPNCGNEYYSNACPDCGYSANASNTTTYIVTNTSTRTPVKKRKTWLWVLGWIFIFPVPLTILLLRKKDMNKTARTIILVLAWLVYLLIALTPSKDSATNDRSLPANSQVEQSEQKDVEKDIGVDSSEIDSTENDIIEVNAIDIKCSSSIVIGEETQCEINITPDYAQNKDYTLSSSNPAVLSVDEKGKVIGLTGGTSTITATTANGVEGKIDITVDGTTAIKRVSASHTQTNDINIGDELHFEITVNGMNVANSSKSLKISEGDTLTFFAEIRESDKDPDIGTNSITHTVTHDDLANGFEVSFEVYVTENGGKNAGKSAIYNVKYTVR